MTSSVGVQQFDASGTLVFDTRTAIGGVGADFREYAAGSSGETISYTQFSGYSAMLLGYDQTITMDTSAGYPVVTVAASADARSFLLLVY